MPSVVGRVEASRRRSNSGLWKDSSGKRAAYHARFVQERAERSRPKPEAHDLARRMQTPEFQDSGLEEAEVSAFVAIGETPFAQTAHRNSTVLSLTSEFRRRVMDYATTSNVHVNHSQPHVSQVSHESLVPPSASVAPASVTEVDAEVGEAHGDAAAQCEGEGVHGVCVPDHPPGHGLSQLLSAGIGHPFNEYVVPYALLTLAHTVTEDEEARAHLDVLQRAAAHDVNPNRRGATPRPSSATTARPRSAGARTVFRPLELQVAQLDAIGPAPPTAKVERPLPRLRDAHTATRGPVGRRGSESKSRREPAFAASVITLATSAAGRPSPRPAPASTPAGFYYVLLKDKLQRGSRRRAQM